MRADHLVVNAKIGTRTSIRGTEPDTKRIFEVGMGEKCLGF